MAKKQGLDIENDLEEKSNEEEKSDENRTNNQIILVQREKNPGTGNYENDDAK